MLSRKKYVFLIVAVIFSFLININNIYALDIFIKDINIIEKSNTIGLSDTEFNDNDITSGITFNELNDFVTYEITLLNKDSNDYIVESITDNNNNEYVSIEYNYDDSKLEKNKTKKIIAKLKYNKKLINKDDIKIDNLRLTLNLVENNGERKIVELNPTTGDKILFYVILAVIALISLVFFILLLKRRKSKKNLVLLLMLLPIIMGAKKVLYLNIDFKNINIKAEMLPYTVIIEDGSENISTRIVKYGSKIGNLPNATKSGYNFIKYVDQDNNEVTSDTIIYNDITIKPVFSLIEYDITYINEGNDVENKTKYSIEDTFTLNNPTKEGYSFSGWTGDSIEGMQTRVTITNSTGNLSFKANFSPNEDTKYTVIHKYPNLNSGYDEVEEVLEGSTDSYVTPALIEKHGFKGPNLETVKIKADGSTVVTYMYTRLDYTFEITDRTYAINSTLNGSYPYETMINISAIERAGYKFEWSDGNTDLDRSFKLNDDTSLSLIYIPRTDTKYTVLHKLKDLNSNTYTIRDTMEYYDITDKVVIPPTNEYQGFISPSSQQLRILGDGTASLEYLYERAEYTIKFDSNGGSDVPDKIVTYGNNLGNLTIPDYPNYEFIGWYTLKTGGEQVDENYMPTSNMTLYAHWKYNPFPIVFSEQGACTFNGTDSNITGDECSNYHNKEYIDTNIALYSESNYNKDYEIGFNIDSFDLNNQLRQSTLVNTKNELGNNISAGLVFRFYESSSQLELSQYINSTQAKVLGNSDDISKVVIVRKNGNYYYSFNDGFYKLLQEKIEPPDMHNVTTWFGSSRDSAGEPIRQFKGTLSNMYIRLGSYDSDNYTITFDPNGGIVSESSRTRKGLEALGDLPTPTKDNARFIGWYTKPVGGDKVEKSSLISKSVTLYAHWASTGSIVEVNGTYYANLNKALNAVPTDGTETTITLLDDIDTYSTISLGKNVVINTDGHTITNSNNSYIFEVSGKLTITNGNIISNAQSASAINVTSTGELYLNGGSIEATGTKQAIYNNGGKVVLDGGANLINESSNRATVQVLGNGVLDIKDSTIISNNYCALRIDKGTVNIGIDDDNIIKNTAILQGKTYAVSTAVNFNMYDGKLMGRTDVVDDISKLKIGSSVQTITGTETVGRFEFKNLYLKNNN